MWSGKWDTCIYKGTLSPRCARTLDCIYLIAQTTDGIAIVLIVVVETHASTGMV
jgi:hypothetical protein